MNNENQNQKQQKQDTGKDNDRKPGGPDQQTQKNPDGQRLNPPKDHK